MLRERRLPVLAASHAIYNHSPRCAAFPQFGSSMNAAMARLR